LGDLEVGTRFALEVGSLPGAKGWGQGPG